jgi:hypothetical protein
VLYHVILYSESESNIETLICSFFFILFIKFIKDVHRQLIMWLEGLSKIYCILYEKEEMLLFQYSLF